MLAKHYKQILEMTAEPKKYSYLPYYSITLMIAALALFVTSVFVSFYLMIPAAVLFLAGVAIRQFFYSVIVEYHYVLSDDTLHIEKMNFLKKTTVVKDIQMRDVLGLDLYSSPEENEIRVTDRLEAMKLVFIENHQRIALVFSPDDYLKALLYAKLEGDDETSVFDRMNESAAINADMSPEDSAEYVHTNTASFAKPDGTDAPKTPFSKGGGQDETDASTEGAGTTEESDDFLSGKARDAVRQSGAYESEFEDRDILL